MDDKLIYRMPGLIKAIGLGKTTIYKMMKAGTFPRPVRIADDRVGWPVSDVRAWVQSRPRVEE